MDIREKIAQLPHQPGVYRFFDQTGTIIYVGKAKDLIKRVSQYMRPADQLDRKTNALVAHIADVQYTVVETEEDALLLENNLIKQLQPHYNILLKDDKTYPWICVSDEPFPRIFLTRRYRRDGSRYYGPYASVQHAHRLLDMIANIWKIRTCRHALTPEAITAGRIRPCLEFQIRRCAAPCAGRQSREEYDRQIAEIHSLLSGRVRNLISDARARMEEAAADLRFEEAAAWQSRMRFLEMHHNREKVVGHGLLDMETYSLLKEKRLPRQVANARKGVDQLQKDLGMAVRPDHIECFDNSNIQGTDPVASCVVFKGGVPSRKDYRHFNIKTVIGADDFASMKEVVNRRYSRLLAEGQPLPQLVVIDGGKGQLHNAYDALCELGLTDRIKVVGLAKRMEEVLVPGDPHPLFLDKNSSSLRILMHIRDEAHRFGITHHRNRRSKRQVASELRAIRGVGEKSETALLRRFKSVARIRRASEAEIAEVVGKALAARILMVLQAPQTDNDTNDGKE